jgi:hypothetical protein
MSSPGRTAATTIGAITFLFQAHALASWTEIQDPVTVSITESVTPPLVNRAVKTALLHRGWTLAEEKPGSLEATLVKPGSYTAKIGVTYDARKVTLKYLASEGLSYDEKDHTIHANYNKWMRLLSQDIQTYVSLLASEPPAPGSAAAPAAPAEAPPSPGPSAPTPPPAPVTAGPAAPAPPPSAAPWNPSAGAAAKLRAGAEVHARPTAEAGAAPKVSQAKVTLKATVKNAVGTWWLVTMPGDSGWVLEKDLEAPTP